jgi:hypothetical protein
MIVVGKAVRIAETITAAGRSEAQRGMMGGGRQNCTTVRMPVIRMK